MIQSNTQNNLNLVINVMNVQFTVQESSGLAKIVTDLELQYKQLNNSIRHKLDINKISDIAINILSSYQQLMEQNPHQYHDYDQFINHTIGTGIDFIELFQQNLVELDGFPLSIYEDMVSSVSSFFDKMYKHRSVDELIYKVKLFEWLAKEGLVESKTYQRSFRSWEKSEKKSNFSDDVLEEFFITNRADILKYIARESNGNLVAMDNPLETTRDSYLFNNYNSLLKVRDTNCI